MMPITLVQTVNDEPTCCATSRLETSSRIMMHRLLVKARAYGNSRARTDMTRTLPPFGASVQAAAEALRRKSTQRKPGTPYPTRARAHNGAVSGAIAPIFPHGSVALHADSSQNK